MLILIMIFCAVSSVEFLKLGTITKVFLQYTGQANFANHDHERSQFKNAPPIRHEAKNFSSKRNLPMWTLEFNSIEGNINAKEWCTKNRMSSKFKKLVNATVRDDVSEQDL